VEESFSALQQFMADAGHELSTPISIILANTESIEADINDESLKKRLATVSRSTERMSSLVNDMTLLAKMGGKHFITKMTLIDFSKLLREAMADFTQLFQAQNIHLIEGSIHSVHLFGDIESLKRVLNNLLQNALKYTNTDGTVKVSLETIGKQAKLTIADTGIGIPAESLSHIFDRFYRVEQSRARTAGGSGLGLSIVKAIVDAHKGKIEVQSAPGTGTIFSILLPLK